jgi:hypothetical protein
MPYALRPIGAEGRPRAILFANSMIAVPGTALAQLVDGLYVGAGAAASFV